MDHRVRKTVGAIAPETKVAETTVPTASAAAATDESPLETRSVVETVLPVEPALSGTAGQQEPAEAEQQVWTTPDIPELHAHLNAARTFGFMPSVTVAGDQNATWIRPLIDLPLEFPHTWIKGPREARFLASRQRIRTLLDRLCGSDAATTPPKTVVVVAHPDDEVIGAGARLRDLPDAIIVYVTDGAPRDPEYALRKGYATREAYAKARQEELVAALAVIGISPERTRCLDIVDGEAAKRLMEVTYLVAEVLDELRPELVLTHAYEGGHTDHDATAFAVHLACGILRRDGVPAPIVLELTSYHFYEGQRRVGDFLPFFGMEERTVELEAMAQAMKQEMYDAFVTQQACLSEFELTKLREKFRPAPRYVFTLPPHAGPLLYERLSQLFSGQQWREGAMRALDRLRSKRRGDTRG